MKVPLLDLHKQYEPVKEKIKKEINDLLETHQYILGPKVKEFETKMESYLNVKNAIGCANGSDALVLALLALNVGHGDEVITTPFTFFATVGSIHRVGATPVFVDINPDTFNIDVNKIEEKITENTKVIMPVHLFGQMSEMDKIMEIARKHNLRVIEDNAQGIGASFDGKIAGTVGDIGTLSFFPSKNLGAMGDGGMCLTNNDELAERLRKLRVHGEIKKYYHIWVGFNSRLDSIHAAVLNVKLDYLEGWSEGRRKNANYYYENLKDVEEIQLPVIHKKAKSVFNQFTIKAKNRDKLLNHLKANDIGCAIYYPKCLHLQECFQYLGYKEGDFPVAEKISSEVLSIPIFKELEQNQIDFVIEKIKEFYK